MIWKQHMHAEEREKDGNNIIIFHAHKLVMFRRCIISVASARASFWHKLTYIVKFLFPPLSFLLLPGWQPAWLLPSNSDCLRASAVPALCPLPGHERSAEFLSCEGRLSQIQYTGERAGVHQHPAQCHPAAAGHSTSLQKPSTSPINPAALPADIAHAVLPLSVLSPVMCPCEIKVSFLMCSSIVLNTTCHKEFTDSLRTVL